MITMSLAPLHTSFFVGCLGAAALAQVPTGGASLSGPLPRPEVRNLGQASDAQFFESTIQSAPIFGTDIVVYRVIESGQAGTDLNGDGDDSDRVLHVFDARTGTTHNVGVAANSWIRVEGNQVAFSVPESFQGGVDLDGNGSTDGHVLHLYDGDSNTLTNLSFPLSDPFDLDFDGNRFVWSWPENNISLNQDADLDDSVVHLYDRSTSTLTNLALAGGYVAITPSMAAFLVDEAGEGTDLNGDTDTDDQVYHAHRFATGVTRNLGLARLPKVGGPHEFRACGDLAILLVREANQSVDLDGDGDLDDWILYVYDAASDVVTDFSAALAVTYQIHATHTDTDGRYVAMQVDEVANQMDWNGNGVISDDVVFFWDSATGVLTNTGLSVSKLGYKVPNLRIDGSVLTLAAQENSIDLNGDGDTIDHILHAVDLQTGSVSFWPYAVPSSISESHWVGDRLYFRVAEGAQSQTDLNGDGDSNDTVLHELDSRTGQVTNLREVVSAVQGSGRHLVTATDEGNAGVIDLNGDGDDDDTIVRLYDTVARRWTNTRLPITGFGILTHDFLVANGRASVLAHEPSAGEDLNGDGDQTDRVVHVIELN